MDESRLPACLPASFVCARSRQCCQSVWWCVCVCMSDDGFISLPTATQFHFEQRVTLVTNHYGRCIWTRQFSSGQKEAWLQGLRAFLDGAVCRVTDSPIQERCTEMDDGGGSGSWQAVMSCHLLSRR